MLTSIRVAYKPTFFARSILRMYFSVTLTFLPSLTCTGVTLQGVGRFKGVTQRDLSSESPSQASTMCIS